MRQGGGFAFLCSFHNFYPQKSKFLFVLPIPGTGWPQDPPLIIPHPDRLVNTFFKNLFLIIFKKPLQFTFGYAII
jgi:hypothetical protein